MRVSITYTVLIWVGIIFMIIGLGVSLSFPGKEILFEFKLKDFILKTNQIGPLIMISGAFLAGGVAIKLPKDVTVLSEDQGYSLAEKLARKLPLLALGVVLLALLFLFF
ncbi:hypothetical protein [Thermosulfuriphilus sp.]